MANKMWHAYTRILNLHPVRTMAATTGTLMGAGDLLAQTAVEGRSMKQLDPGRTARFFGYGLIIAGPALRGWYLLLEKSVKASTFAPVKKMLLDQAFMAPAFLTTFITVMSKLKGHSWTTVKENMSHDFLPVLLNSYKVWPAVQLFNFYLVPLQHRVLVVNVVALGWNTYLAWRTERREHHRGVGVASAAAAQLPVTDTSPQG